MAGSELGVTTRCSRCWRKLSKRFERLDDGRLALIEEGCAHCRKAEEERIKRAKLLEQGWWSP
jgi:hypothetical protein